MVKTPQLADALTLVKYRRSAKLTLNLHLVLIIAVEGTQRWHSGDLSSTGPSCLLGVISLCKICMTSKSLKGYYKLIMSSGQRAVKNSLPLVSCLNV